MDKYLAFWRRGWWAWLFMLLANLAFGIIVIPLAIAFRGNIAIYWTSAIGAWFLVGAPLTGFLFERFAAGSPRINPTDFPANAA